VPPDTVCVDFSDFHTTLQEYGMIFCSGDTQRTDSGISTVSDG